MIFDPSLALFWLVNATMEAPDLSGNRYLVITDDDRRGTILVVAIICCVYCPMVLALRAVTTLKNLSVDDFLALASTVRSALWASIMVH